ncbi:MAG TPA: amidophosphoribosyltransferase [Bdellovibrionota bacterium]|nr:amidophosphoribosyltransferase [Bdellovibrionota bacterium]
MCGIVGLIGSPEAAREAFLGLTTLQHRGQDAAGILTYDKDGFHRVKNLGLVESVFTRENMATLGGSLAVAHARYSTVGRGDPVDVQPFLISYPYGLGIVHNGNLVNTAELGDDLAKKHRRRLLTHSDTEILLNLLAQGLSQTVSEGDRLSFDDLCKGLETVYSQAKGSFSVVTLIADHGLLAFRDPVGNRPISWGKRAQTGEGALPSGEAHMIASESVALAFNGYEKVRDLQPGEALFIDLQGKVHTRVIRAEKRRPCMFEWVYFASPESEIDGVPVYGTRIQLGRQLATQVRKVFKERGFEADMVVPVPESSRIAAIALAEELKLPYRETLIKNRYIKRTFILDSQDKRNQAVDLKLSPVRSEIEGKRLLLVDDSIVRGTTSRKLVDLVRKAGAAQVFFVSTCPPIKHPCFYGIDFPNEEELIANARSTAEIEKELGADAVIYQDLPGLQEAIASAPANHRADFTPCMACLDGKYPIDVAAAQKFASLRRADRRATNSSDRREKTGGHR